MQRQTDLTRPGPAAHGNTVAYVNAARALRDFGEDRAAGLVWRAKDADNYYVVRATALEDNVVLCKTARGVRSSLDIVGRKGGYGAKVPVSTSQWHSLRVAFAATRFKVIYNGNTLFEVENASISDAGMVGLWTKADSVTWLNSFSFGEQR